MASQVAISITREKLCGICEEPNADTFWNNQLSRWAHLDCIEKIQDFDEDLWTNIRSFVPDPREALLHSEAHKSALQAIKRLIGNVSILTFLETEGVVKLTKIFISQDVSDAIEKTRNSFQAQPIARARKFEMFNSSIL